MEAVRECRLPLLKRDLQSAEFPAGSSSWKHSHPATAGQNSLDKWGSSTIFDLATLSIPFPALDLSPIEWVSLILQLPSLPSQNFYESSFFLFWPCRRWDTLFPVREVAP